MRLYNIVPSLVLCAVLGAGASGCSDGQAGTAAQATEQTDQLTTLPDCDSVSVLSTFEARPSGVDGFYIVSDGNRPVCSTDFDGLQALATRFDTSASTESLRVDPTGSDPMPGHDNESPTGSDPMPGHNNMSTSIKASR